VERAGEFDFVRLEHARRGAVLQRTRDKMFAHLRRRKMLALLKYILRPAPKSE